ncbi:MAG: hypothetical protein ACRYG8_10295 [Janthinobacterium lividum]
MSKSGHCIHPARRTPTLSKPLPDAVDSLATGLLRALAETGWSARGLSAAAGLGPDAVRNATRGASRTLRGDRLERIAAVLGIPVAALTGEQPWPRRKLPPAPMAEPQPRRRLGDSARIPEVDLRPGASGTGSGIRDLPEVGTWTVPTEMLAERGLRGEDLVIVRAPSAVPGRRIVAGDRLLVDVGDAARRPGSGLAVIHGARGYRLVEAPGARAVVVGRVVGRWEWM